MQLITSYSPDRNQDEYLNCDLKYGLSEKLALKTIEILKENAENKMSMLKKNSNRVAKYFNHLSIKYAG